VIVVDDFDVVRLKDGREGTVLDTYTDPQLAYEVELDDVEGDLITVEPEDIAEVIWHRKDHPVGLD